MTEAEFHDRNPSKENKENAEHLFSLGDVALRRSDISPANMPTAEQAPKLPEVICGRDSGYIRTSPELVHAMLTRSVEDAHVIPDGDPRTAAAVRRANSVIAHFGVVTAESQTRQHGVIEAYEAVTYVRAGNDFDEMVIKANGPLDVSQLPESAERIETPVGGLLPEPTIDISFTKYGKNESSITHRFIFARDGHAHFERSVDGSSYRVETLDSDTALNYLEQHLPVVENDAGQPALSQGTARISKDTFSSCFDTVRRNRLGHNGDDIRLAARDKLATFGYDTVLFVPEAYFEGNSRDGEFFSVDVPETLIPTDVLVYSDLKSRAESIAGQMETNIDKTTLNDAVYIAEGLPGGQSKIAFLIQREHDAPYPHLELRPTKAYDKSLKYLLQHPDLVANTIGAYREMIDILGEEPVSETNIQIALEAGLLNRDQNKARKMFKHFTMMGIGTRGASVQAVLDKAFVTLAALGDRLKEVYSEEELAHYAQHNALLAA